MPHHIRNLGSITWYFRWFWRIWISSIDLNSPRYALESYRSTFCALDLVNFSDSLADNVERLSRRKDYIHLAMIRILTQDQWMDFKVKQPEFQISKCLLLIITLIQIINVKLNVALLGLGSATHFVPNVWILLMDFQSNSQTLKGLDLDFLQQETLESDILLI